MSVTHQHRQRQLILPPFPNVISAVTHLCVCATCILSHAGLLAESYSGKSHAAEMKDKKREIALEVLRRTLCCLCLLVHHNDRTWLLSAPSTHKNLIPQQPSRKGECLVPRRYRQRRKLRKTSISMHVAYLAGGDAVSRLRLPLFPLSLLSALGICWSVNPVGKTRQGGASKCLNKLCVLRIYSLPRSYGKPTIISEKNI